MSDKIIKITKDTSKTLLGDVRTLIESAKTGVARAVNSGLVMLYWRIGDRIRKEVLKGKRAD